MLGCIITHFLSSYSRKGYHDNGNKHDQTMFRCPVAKRGVFHSRPAKLHERADKEKQYTNEELRVCNRKKSQAKHVVHFTKSLLI